MTDKKAFLTELLALCEKYGEVEFCATTDEEVAVNVNDEEVMPALSNAASIREELAKIDSC